MHRLRKFRFFTLFTLGILSLPVNVIARGEDPKPYSNRYHHAADNETLPALSDFCNQIDRRIIDLRRMKDESWFLFKLNRDLPEETYNQNVCESYRDIFLQACNLDATLSSYRSVTCSHGNRLDWNHFKNSRSYLPCKADCHAESRY